MCSHAAPQPLKIALLTHSVNPRGGVVHTLELARALHDAGHAVTVLAPAKPGQTMFRPVPHRLELLPYAELADDPHADQGSSLAAMVASRIAAFEARLETLLATEHFDVLHAQDGMGANALANLQDRGLIDRFVRTVHHLDDFADPRVAAWQWRGVERAAQVLCVSQGWCDTLRDVHGIEAALVHNGVDCTRYSPLPDANDARVALRYGLQAGLDSGVYSGQPAGRPANPRRRASDAPLLLAVGGVEERKNSCRIVDAFAAFRATRPNAQLLIAGGVSLLDHAAYAADFHARAQAAGLVIGRRFVADDKDENYKHDDTDAQARPAIVLTGAVADADMPALFRAADALLMPSVREGFGLVVLEALASGTPVLASRIAPFTEYLNLDGADDCVWADPFDTAAITRAMHAVLAPARAAALAAQLAVAPPAVCRRFAWPASAARHVALYRAHVLLHATHH